MRFGTMGIAAGITSAVVVCAGSGAYIWKQKPPTPSVASSGSEILPVQNQAAEKISAAAPTWSGNRAVRFYSNDAGAAEFLNLSLPCSSGSATIFDFLSMRAIEIRSIADLKYTIFSEIENGRIFILVEERNNLLVGSNPAIPVKITYRYELTDYSVNFIGSVPSGFVFQEPAGYMRIHRDAVCNGLIGLGLIRFSTESNPYPEQPDDDEKRARFASILSRPAPKMAPLVEATDRAPRGTIIFRPGSPSNQDTPMTSGEDSSSSQEGVGSPEEALQIPADNYVSKAEPD